MNTMDTDHLQHHLPILDGFGTVSLQQITAVALLDRVELKFLLPLPLLPRYLHLLAASHNALEIDGLRQFGYTTHYFDTPDLTIYHDHHNGHTNRIKVRRRCYDQSGMCFFEVKRKVNDRRTDKARLKIADMHGPLSAAETALISYPRLRGQVPEFRLNNRFQRITLCDRMLTERVTIDTGITMAAGSGFKTITGAALVEVKQHRMNVASPAISAMRSLNISSAPFSKYALGITFLFPGVKYNTFRPVMLKLEQYAAK